MAIAGPDLIVAPSVPTALTASFVALVLVMAASLVVATARAGRRLDEPPERRRRWVVVTAIGVALWLALTGGAAELGLLRDFSATPPGPLRLFGLAFALTITFGATAPGRRLATGLSLGALIGFQVFRLPVEVILDQLHHAGVIPVQMTFEGRNFDILTGLSAPLVAWAAARGRLSTSALLAWNTLCLALLVNIVAIAVLSMPTSFRVFMDEPANTFIAFVPWIWLPMVLVLAALLGHVLVFHRVLRERRDLRSR